ncbi:hypothetical protein LOD99_15679 [Oopsacas minuta]|uniref:Uncharacterized protein n=1 Tax=Oopsacas minuta TaxID=111878 RepID=A0AAV7K9M4_9METZ|nr:hypothetical protein LOD99_15679 [Oopsacas minuta]
MSDPFRHPNGILPNYTHNNNTRQDYPVGAQLNPLYLQQGNLVSHQQQPLQEQIRKHQLQLQQLQQQQSAYSNYPYNSIYAQPIYQQPIQPYIESAPPNAMFYQSLPIPNKPHSPFTELRGSILPPIYPMFDPHPPKYPYNKFNLGTYANRIVKYTRKEAAVIIQMYWRGYWVRKHVRPILKRLRQALHNKEKFKNRELIDSVYRSIASDLISEAVELMVVNFVIDWLDYSAYLVLLDLECFVLRDNIIDDVLSNDFIEEIVQECLLEEITVELYNEILWEETRDVLLTELSLERNTTIMKKLTINDIQDNLSNVLNEFIISELISGLDTQDYDLSQAREMQKVKDGLIMNALISLLEQVET